MLKIPGNNKFHIHALVDTRSSYCLARQNLLPTDLWKALEVPLQVTVGSRENISLPIEARNIHLDIGVKPTEAYAMSRNEDVLQQVFKKRSKRGDEIPPLETLFLTESSENEVRQVLESTCSEKPLEWWHTQKRYAGLELLDPEKEIRQKPMVYTPNFEEFSTQINDLLTHGLIHASYSPHTSPTFLVRNHAVIKHGKARMLSFKTL
ncbi:uncharacterized protein [Aristolochia californica]|uniref:uncharacterized protein n=1 Tax=Aristolochia californica TaxID=171875 RepID=UPI0035D55AE5